MEIKVAENAGFCFGVMRALNIAKKVKSKSDSDVYTFGPLIHNMQVVEKMEEEGIHPIYSLENIKRPCKLIIRSHGVPPQVVNEAKKRGFDVIDATCPFVRRVQNFAQELKKEGYRVIVFGDDEHPEVKGIIGHAGKEAETMNLAHTPLFNANERIGLVSQTTQSIKNFIKAVGYIVERVQEVKIYNTICSATYLRQKSTENLSKEVKIMLVVGGRMSANTGRLKEISQSQGCETYHIETKEELKREWLIGKEKIGVTAGASTPSWIINDVIDGIKKMIKEE